MTENSDINLEAKIIIEKINKIYNRKKPPENENFLLLLEKANIILNNEDGNLRPLDKQQLPGGIIYLYQDIPTIILPDLHARTNFIISVLNYTINEHSILELLISGSIQIVCVGDGVHSERRAYDRWQKAIKEYKSDFKKHKYMDDEINESFSTMEIIILLKIHFPQYFHFLKGNHENISNEEGNGNYPFGKFAYEGAMFKSYMDEFYSESLFNEYYNFEKNIPIMAIGKNFIISHAEPYEYYKTKNIINYRNNSNIIEGLTWTDNNTAEEGSVEKILKENLPDQVLEKCFYFGGHRYVKDLYLTRANGRYVQIHNPEKYIMTIIDPNKDIDLDNDIFEIKKQ